MSTKTKSKAVEPADAKLAELREKHGFIRRVDVPLRELEDDELLEELPAAEVATFYFRRPKRVAMSAMARFAQSNITRAAEIVLKDALVEGDKTLLDDDEMFYALMPVSKELTQGRSMALKKR